MSATISPVGRDKLKSAVAVLWMLRWDLLAVVIVAVAMMWLSDKVPFASVAPVVPLMGVVVSIFIGFRNSSAYNRWWEARTLWGTVVANCRALNNAFTAVDDCSDEMAVTIDRMRRRQVRHAWQLAAELRRIPTTVAVRNLTPEDPPDATTGELLNRQAAEARDLVLADHIDRQGRVILTNLNTAQATAAGGLERIRNQPIPLYYAFFVRGLAWFFGIMVCTRMDAGTHMAVSGIIAGILIMALFVVAERLGYFAEEPMSNTVFDLPMDHFCAAITADLLGTGHPLARPPQDATAVVWT